MKGASDGTIATTNYKDQGYNRGAANPAPGQDQAWNAREDSRCDKEGLEEVPMRGREEVPHVRAPD
jgi:hypothetical protein